MQPSPPTSSVRQFLWALRLLVATTIAYFPTTRCGFIWDDDDYVTNNPTLRDANGLKRIWLEPSRNAAVLPTGSYDVLVGVSKRGLECDRLSHHQLYDSRIECHFSLAMFACLVCSWALFAALVFAVHPVHVASVAWVTERKNVLSGMFYLLTMLSFLRYWDFTKPINSDEPAESQGHPRFWFALTNLCFIAALLTRFFLDFSGKGEVRFRSFDLETGRWIFAGIRSCVP